MSKWFYLFNGVSLAEISTKVERNLIYLEIVYHQSGFGPIKIKIVAVISHDIHDRISADFHDVFSMNTLLGYCLN
jgi:hypothetical protein